MESKKEKVTLSINYEILIASKKIAIDERCSLSSIVEMLLKEYSENKKLSNH